MPKGSWREFDNSLHHSETGVVSSIQSKAVLPVRIQRTRVGKGGKTVTLITGLDLPYVHLKTLLKKLKAKCGTGGTIKEHFLELQGDQVQIALEVLKKQGYQAKQSGG